MPATNRGLTGAGATSSSTSYLRAQPPAWAMLQTALTVFALFIIARSCARRAYVWWFGPACRTESAASLQGEHAWDPRWAMDEKSRDGAGITSTMKGQAVGFAEGERAASMAKKLTVDPNWRSGALVSRLPPAPPLTPPELSTAVFTIEGTPPHRQDSFIHQPNPDYMSSTSSSSFAQTSAASPSTARRRSYNRTLPIGIPIPQHSSLSDADSADLIFPPSSYPATSPLLPPPPPGTSRADDIAQGRGEVDVKGEIISVLDDEGAGWTRHTRVYGGGVCLACAASGGEHGGGFYGATVTPEEMR
ncbi:hypothetical protein TOPH_07016 [Tolypocladium ophioglossoides CBS 100239]|uniref:Uncharacterized protein n=1 Tax=Tolypocladium ophioglossoides (strain CBS 100239) TaxID=1163406 RepID=A0A0L0N352_TOLOC|nr:hypothetical protein TOPH_07016 [Tolypocladium ophioglossoides CBS 100239]